MTKIIKTDEEWKSLLTEDEFYITRQKGTEPAFSGKNFQIVNGGQTVASLWHTNTKMNAPLDNIFVQMKIPMNL